MEHLIPIASKLQDVLGALGQTTTLDLPQIVVVGGQSSGKSSVLEGIVGRSFLPRGHGIVTRRPLILQLYNTADMNKGHSVGGSDFSIGGGTSRNDDDENDEEQEHEEEEESDEESEKSVNDVEKNANHHNNKNTITEGQEWGEFLHLPGRRFFNFTEIRSEIVNDTNRLTGQNKGINPTPIHLKIYSPHVLALTMVDLPGMAKVAVGDQPADIEQQIREMSMQYISNPNAIILAITSANTDLANSDALQLAQEVDPYGERTLGVLTKLDLMDPGTDASDVLRNKVIPLRKGYIGVVNRGQLDVESDLTIRDGLKKEQHFFRNHPCYGGRDRSLSGRLGTMNLARQLNSILMHHIRECLPELKSRIAGMMNDVHLELEALGTTTNGTSRSNLGGALLALLSKFSTNFANTIEGRGTTANVMNAWSTTNDNGGGGDGGGMNGYGNRNGHSNNDNSHATNHSGMNGNNNNNNNTSNVASLTPAGAATPAQPSDMNILFGGARISYIFNDVFASSLMSVGAFDGITDEEIQTTICNANGTRPSLFVPEISFDILARRQISRLEQPGIQCVDLVYEELQRIASQCEPTELTRFPNLRDRMVEVVSGLLRRAVGPTQMMVSNLVKIELAYINTSHPDFIGGSQAVARLMRKTEKEKEEKEKQRILQEQQQQQLQQQQQQQGNTNGTTGARSLNSDTGGDVTTPQLQGKSGVAACGGGEEGGDSGGIMNFIFGPKTPNQKSTHTKSIFRTPLGGNGSTNGTFQGGHHHHHGGPPSIVQLPQVPDTMRQTDVPPTDREKIETEIIKSLIESYFAVVRKNFIDLVPKTIMYFLVNHVRDAMQNELVAELYRDAEVPMLMKEAEDVAQRRKACVEMKDLLTTALDIVNEVRDFNTFK